MWHSTSYKPFQPLRKAVLSAVILSFVGCSDSTSPSRAINTDAPPPGVTVLTWTYPDSIKNPMLAGSASLIGGAHTPSANVTSSPLAALLVAPSAPNYTVSTVPFAPEAAPVTGLGPNCDDCLWIDNPIGFSFAFFGRTYDKINLGSNGIVGFGVDNMRDGCCNGIPMPVNDVYNNVIAIGQNDWMPNAVAKAIRYETRGTAPNRRFVLQYTNVPESGGNGRLTVQIVLAEGSNEITIYTTTLSTTLRTRLFTQGIEDATGSEAFFVAGRVRSSFSLANDAVKFTPPVPNRAPVITAPPNISVTTALPPADSSTIVNKGLVPNTGVCAAVVDPGSPAVIDDAAGATATGSRNDGLPLDMAYPKGTTTITWTAIDAEGLTATATQTITVSDNEIPSIFAPANLSTRTDPGASTATVAVGVATVADNCPNVAISTSRSDNLPLSASFSVGTTTIQWIATDASGNTNSANQNVTVVGNKPPVASAPASISVNTDPGVCSAVVNPGLATATDDATGVSIAGVRNDGGAINGSYPKGVTTITWTATDADGLTAVAMQTVGVMDNQKPSVQAPSNIVVDNTGGLASAAVFVGSAVAEDNCHQVSVSGARSDGGALTGLYPVGTTTITWTAIDPSGNSASAAQTVTVRDITIHDVEAPRLNVPADFAVNATMPSGAVVNFAVSASDNLAGASVSCDHNSGSVFPIGYTSVTCTATDASGNRTTKTFGVDVLSADEQIGNLIKYVEALPIRDNASKKLVKELSKVLREHSDRKSCEKMDDFIERLDKRGRGMPAAWSAWSAYMTSEALRIESVMGCRSKHQDRDSKHDDRPGHGSDNHPGPAASSRR